MGCTATIITQMYDENGVEIEPKIAGLLLAAILSDTLVFRSPTCTPIDVAAAKRLAKIAGVDIDEFALEMFEAGENLAGKTAEEVFLQDFKVFMCGDVRFGVAQGSYMTRKNLQAAQKLLQPYLEEARNKQNVEDLYMLLTDVPKEESVVICAARRRRQLDPARRGQPQKAVHPRLDDGISGAVKPLSPCFALPAPDEGSPWQAGQACAYWKTAGPCGETRQQQEVDNV